MKNSFIEMAALFGYIFLVIAALMVNFFNEARLTLAKVNRRKRGQRERGA